MAARSGSRAGHIGAHASERREMVRSREEGLMPAPTELTGSQWARVQFFANSRWGLCDGTRGQESPDSRSTTARGKPHLECSSSSPVFSDGDSGGRNPMRRCVDGKKSACSHPCRRAYLASPSHAAAAVPRISSRAVRLSRLPSPCQTYKASRYPMMPGSRYIALHTRRAVYIAHA